ncbi:hypothetical protein BDV12DRAFT_190239 [Aspergillus spectabilis]
MGLLAALTTFFLLLRYTSADLPPDFPGDETPYRVIPTGTTDSVSVISSTKGVASGIDWNNAAALEFLGPPGLNKDQQSQRQAVFANTATVIVGI